MNLFHEIADKLRNLPIKKMVIDAISENENVIEGLQRDQMRDGEDRFGAELGRLRNTSYARRKKSKGGQAPFGVVDLKNKGPFQANIKASISGSIVSIGSTDSKASDLQKKYGKKMWGLQPSSWRIFSEEILFDELRVAIPKFLHG